MKSYQEVYIAIHYQIKSYTFIFTCFLKHKIMLLLMSSSFVIYGSECFYTCKTILDTTVIFNAIFSERGNWESGIMERNKDTLNPQKKAKPYSHMLPFLPQGATMTPQIFSSSSKQCQFCFLCNIISEILITLFTFWLN